VKAYLKTDQLEKAEEIRKTALKDKINDTLA